jgi:tRNA pseudouridine38-40 synthase
MGRAAPEVRTIKAVVEYDGTRYAGFQQQPHLLTIQGEMERALREVTQEEAKIVGAGRTDAGVHAGGQVIHFLTGWKRSLEDLQPDFHARFSAVTRAYRYTILNQPVRSPLEARYAYHYEHHLDAAAMGQALEYLVGTHDFASFGQPTQGESTLRDVLRVSCSREGNHIHVDLTANAFLRHMARAIVGTLLLVGRGVLHAEDMKAILAAKDRSQAGPPAPAHGLCLVRVNY